MKATIESKNEIETTVRNWFGSRRVCYATPGTERYHSNFYGDTPICRFTRSELVELISVYHAEYGMRDGTTATQSAELVLGDMQFDKPEVRNA